MPEHASMVGRETKIHISPDADLTNSQYRDILFWKPKRLGNVFSGFARKESEEMPTILRIGAYRFFFYSNEDGEPIHVHVIRDRVEAKFWIKPIRLAVNKGFPEHELPKIVQMVAENEETIENEWNSRKSR